MTVLRVGHQLLRRDTRVASKRSHAVHTDQQRQLVGRASCSQLSEPPAQALEELLQIFDQPITGRCP
jgi:hypothetical protein